MTLRTLLSTLTGAVLAAGSLHAQQTVNILPGIAPSSETWTHKEFEVKDAPLGTVVFNVVTPTLTVDHSRLGAQYCCAETHHDNRDSIPRNQNRRVIDGRVKASISEVRKW